MARFPFIIIKLFLCFSGRFFCFPRFSLMAILPLFLILSVALSAQLFTHRYNSFLPTSANTQKYSIFHFFPFDIALYVHLASCIGIVHLVPLGKAVARHSIFLSSHRRLHTRFHFSLTQPVPIFPMAFRILFKIHLSLPYSMHTVWYFSFHL